jgi:hypothetical protein
MEKNFITSMDSFVVYDTSKITHTFTPIEPMWGVSAVQCHYSDTEWEWEWCYARVHSIATFHIDNSPCRKSTAYLVIGSDCEAIWCHLEEYGVQRFFPTNTEPTEEVFQALMSKDFSV